MNVRTKQKLRFYLSLAGIVALTIAVGIVFQYVVYLGWQMKLGLKIIRYDLFATMAAILFVMCILDIYLFFHLVMRRKY